MLKIRNNDNILIDLNQKILLNSASINGLVKLNGVNRIKFC